MSMPYDDITTMKTITFDSLADSNAEYNKVAELKNLHFVTDEMLKKSDPFPETDSLAGEHCWTNIELFTLYAEDYLHRRPDIRHDIWCLVRAQNPTSTGLAL